MSAAAFPAETRADGSFQRQADAFRHTVEAPVDRGRYHLYVSYACPWAHRTMIVRALMGLEEAVGMTVVDPVRDERGWAFRDGDGFGVDPINGFQFLAEAYRRTDPAFDGRATVPVLWDKRTQRIANNSEDDICRFFAEAFRPLARHPFDLFPAAIEKEHAELAQWLHDRVNNGVYAAGFATTQQAYERAVRQLFEALDALDLRLATTRFLFGTTPVEADWRLFCTLVRFDAVYFSHFKCNVRRIADYAQLSGYVRDLWQWHHVAPTVRMDHIKRHYYVTHPQINPTRIVPVGPELHFDAPHDRARQGLAEVTPARAG